MRLGTRDVLTILGVAALVAGGMLWFVPRLGPWGREAPGPRETARSGPEEPPGPTVPDRVAEVAALPPGCEPRLPVNTAAWTVVMEKIPPWKPSDSLRQIAEQWHHVGYRLADQFRAKADAREHDRVWFDLRAIQVALFFYEGDVPKAQRELAALRQEVGRDLALTRAYLSTLYFLEGIAAMRQAEVANCVEHGGRSACILPIASEAVHRRPAGSESAMRWFTALLEAFPDDLQVRWLLNVAAMTLGRWPDGVEPRHRLTLDRWLAPAPGFPRFVDVAPQVGLDRLNQSGGAVLEDFDGDGLLDVVFSCFDPEVSLAVYRNRGDGTFEDRTEAAGVKDQLGGLNCVQTDYDNDGRADLFVVRGAWHAYPVRPSLLRNRGDGTFEDVTEAAGLATPINAASAEWADYDNDGWLDVFIPCERQPCRLYHNRGNGTFEDVAGAAGVSDSGLHCKGAAWIDLENDGRPDLFVNALAGPARLYRNEGGGRFRVADRRMEPSLGFSCWCFDFDNDGWQDLFASCYERAPGDLVNGLLGGPRRSRASALHRNLGGRSLEDVAPRMSLDGVYATMGSNFADFDGDGWLDVYLATGDPLLESLVPNRMFRNLGGAGFQDVSAASGTAHLQKGHGVACGDWDRNGTVDLLVELGGGIPGDKFRNVLFQNPGVGNRWVTLRLVGTTTNRAAIGARVKLVTSAATPLTLHRTIGTGSSFGANPFEQTIGLGHAEGIASLEITWPTSRTTQRFHDVPLDACIEITEHAATFARLPCRAVPAPH